MKRPREERDYWGQNNDQTLQKEVCLNVSQVIMQAAEPEHTSRNVCWVSAVSRGDRMNRHLTHFSHIFSQIHGALHRVSAECLH